MFVSQKLIVDDLSSDLSIQYILVQLLHGDRKHSDWQKELEDFKTRKLMIPIVSDLTSWSCDVDYITHVYNYNFPQNIESMYTEEGMLEEWREITLITRNDL
jgi:superfamily II DNA/RNA helicase